MASRNIYLSEENLDMLKMKKRRDESFRYSTLVNSLLDSYFRSEQLSGAEDAKKIEKKMGALKKKQEAIEKELHKIHAERRALLIKMEEQNKAREREAKKVVQPEELSFFRRAYASILSDSSRKTVYCREYRELFGHITQDDFGAKLRDFKHNYVLAGKEALTL